MCPANVGGAVSANIGSHAYAIGPCSGTAAVCAFLRPCAQVCPTRLRAGNRFSIDSNFRDCADNSLGADGDQVPDIEHELTSLGFHSKECRS